MPGFTPRAAGGGHILSDDESDLIYHIVCARNQPDGQPAKSLQALDYWWYTLDKVKPRSKQIPERNRRVFQHTSDFSRDALTHADRIHDEAYSLLHRKYVAGLPSGVREIDHVFRAADWLAIYFQKRMLFALQATHMLAMLMGLTYIIYSDLLPKRFFLYVFLAFFVLATAIHAFSARQAWHRKYLDYRALAEGLRVQFYWAAAGVTTGKASKFVHDSFLQTQDADLGWIRNVMRVAGTKCDSSTYENPTGLVFALKEWLGDRNSGQLGYFRRKGEERVRRYQRTEHMAKIALWIGGAAIVLFILASAEVGELVRDPVVIYFQKRMLFALQATHMLAMLMGLTYIIYSDLLPKRFFLYVFLAFFVLATAIHAFSARQAWHRKYLDYRALAEGLRVQFYWAAAGVTTGKASKFVHDSFLQTQDADLGWIRNVMRVAGTKCDSSTYENPTGLVFALKEWLGDRNSGQLGYFRRKGEERVRRYQRTEHMAKIALWIGGAAIVLFILASAEVGELVRDPVVILMGVMLLLVGVRQSYGFSIADAELIKQYKFMFRIFHNARRRVDAADSDEERRRILRLLGNAALEEHTQWLLMYRYRALDQTEVWKMGG